MYVNQSSSSTTCYSNSQKTSLDLVCTLLDVHIQACRESEMTDAETLLSRWGPSHNPGYVHQNLGVSAEEWLKKMEELQLFNDMTRCPLDDYIHVLMAKNVSNSFGCIQIVVCTLVCKLVGRISLFVIVKTYM